MLRFLASVAVQVFDRNSSSKKDDYSDHDPYDYIMAQHAGQSSSHGEGSSDQECSECRDNGSR